MLHFMGILDPTANAGNTGSGKKPLFSSRALPISDVRPTDAEWDEAYLSGKCPQPRDEVAPTIFRFVTLAMPGCL